MNRENIYNQLKIDEGVVYEVYKDHLGYPTFGVGHLVKASDPEQGQEKINCSILYPAFYREIWTK